MTMKNIQQRRISAAADGSQWPCDVNAEMEKEVSLPLSRTKEAFHRISLHSNRSSRGQRMVLEALRKKNLEAVPKSDSCKKRVHVDSPVPTARLREKIPEGESLQESVSPPRKRSQPFYASESRASGLEVGLQRLTSPERNICSSEILGLSARKEKERSGSSSDKSPTRGVRGLKNLGNTCYMNAVLQILFSLEGFYLELKKACIQAFPRSEDSPLCSENSVLFALRHVLKQLESDTTSLAPVNPRLLIKAFVTNQTRFGDSTQEDAHEFLCYLLQQVHEEVTSAAKHAEEMSTEDGQQKICFVGEYFSCKLKNTFSCISCGKYSSNEEEYRHFSLGIPEDSSKGPHDLKSLLSNTYFEDTTISRTCEGCGATDFTCRSRLSSFPRVLLLHIKRVQAYSDAESTKSSLPIKFSEQLDLGPWCEFGCQEQQLQREQVQPIPAVVRREDTNKREAITASYKLNGIISHLGHEGSFGHFVADVFHQNGNCWVRCDDSKVTKISSEDVYNASKEREGYMFVYIKQPD